MKHMVDARGLTCPLPVINTKNKIETMKSGESVTVLVDNEIAVQNLTKFAGVREYDIRAEKTADNDYQVVITIGEPETGSSQDEISCVMPAKRSSVVVISSDQMGSGEEELGRALMKAFVFALTKQDVLPETVLLYNRGAFLSCDGSDSLEDLKTLEAQGVEILTCGTCLNYYKLTDRLAAGSVTNMYDIVGIMSGASAIIKP